MRKRANARPTTSLDETFLNNDGNLAMQVIDDRETAQDRVEKGERITAIEAAMKHLPLHQRSILLMYHAQAMSYEDIAATLLLPIGTVKSRLNRARLSLRTMLRPCRNLFIVPKTRKHAIIHA